MNILMRGCNGRSHRCSIIITQQSVAQTLSKEVIQHAVLSRYSCRSELFPWLEDEQGVSCMYPGVDLRKISVCRYHAQTALLLHLLFQFEIRCLTVTDALQPRCSNQRKHAHYIITTDSEKYLTTIIVNYC